MCSDEEGSGMADLQRMLEKVVSSKKASARQKQAELIKVSRRYFRLLLSTEVPVMMPNGIDFSVLCFHCKQEMLGWGYQTCQSS